MLLLFPCPLQNCRVDGFMSVGIQTLVFPSEETKRNRKRENASIDINEINYEVFTTKDSLRVGVKLLVAYKIVDPRKAIIALTKEGIVKHVENCCVVDMGKSIQACSSKDFLSSAQNKPVRPNGASSSGEVSPGEPSLLQHFQDTVKMALAADLHEYGIELVRLNFETPKVLDKVRSTRQRQTLLMARRARLRLRGIADLLELIADLSTCHVAHRCVLLFVCVSILAVVGDRQANG